MGFSNLLSKSSHGELFEQSEIQRWGKVFETTATKLANAGRNSVFGAMLDESWNLISGSYHAEYFIDRNPNCFAVLLDLFRTGKLYIPTNISKKLLYREALYYGLLDHIHSAKWGQFDGNRLILSGFITSHAPGDGSAIRVSPDGECFVAHGSMAYVYDWMLEEHPPLNLDYHRVNVVRWVDSENIIIGICECPRHGDG